MTRLRITLAQSMAIVLYLGFGFAALRNADEFLASATFTLTIVTISAALVGAFVRRGPARAAWIGFATFAWAYLLIDVLPPRASGGLGFGPLPWPPRLIEWGFARLQPYLRPVPPPTAFPHEYLTPYEQVGHSLGIILFGLFGSVLGYFLAPRDERVRPGAGE
jgi:hypothetical protein